jgi:hypothetical protein
VEELAIVTGEHDLDESRTNLISGFLGTAAKKMADVNRPEDLAAILYTPLPRINRVFEEETNPWMKTRLLVQRRTVALPSTQAPIGAGAK